VITVYSLKTCFNIILPSRHNLPKGSILWDLLIKWCVCRSPRIGLVIPPVMWLRNVSFSCYFISLSSYSPVTKHFPFLFFLQYHIRIQQRVRYQTWRCSWKRVRSVTSVWLRDCDTKPPSEIIIINIFITENHKGRGFVPPTAAFKAKSYECDICYWLKILWVWYSLKVFIVEFRHISTKWVYQQTRRLLVL
jgi:hypothetical protein